MTISSISSVSLKPMSFKQAQKTQNGSEKKSSVAKKAVVISTGTAILAGFILGSVNAVKKGKFKLPEKIKLPKNVISVETIKNIFKSKKNNAPVFKGTISESFSSAKEMADEIVKDFRKMKDRVRAHNFKSYFYNNKMDWNQAPIKRAEALVSKSPKITKSVLNDTNSRKMLTAREMADGIVKDFEKMKNRLKIHNIKNRSYNKMDWEQTPILRSEMLK